ncbi:hypothetical protein chiPu_0019769 [Chiloscyllium punctatum]|uniref:Uncharacterized protein n=1 Tax=Chiloscyllium punctatum TaxID=137246 RepID=A0A401RT30_CHIPU|nr:hypothetical protein [Chiloscyllium punctatum]
MMVASGTVAGLTLKFTGWEGGSVMGTPETPTVRTVLELGASSTEGGADEWVALESTRKEMSHTPTSTFIIGFSNGELERRIETAWKTSLSQLL